MPRASKANSDYMANGVAIMPSIPSVGDNLTIKYDGLLSKSGASHIYAHVGFGNKWNHLYDYPMTRTMSGFEVTIPVSEADTLNVCFKDCANNWDNNSGMNYSFDISK
ncbi:MAG TPA: carbohydrate-binding protein [Acetivibrio sp.]|nr:carbohydrate-binding protein [Clostridium sp.]HOQ37139.1 carbohydrate-binding protein [Acetivibrio sp.]HPT90236.1 carbohydrate-binding protein [Acetivibrio sp.]HQA56338.1 carbohydrate-binding protein [Acetivibrio sp.]